MWRSQSLLAACRLRVKHCKYQNNLCGPRSAEMHNCLCNIGVCNTEAQSDRAPSSLGGRALSHFIVDHQHANQFLYLRTFQVFQHFFVTFFYSILLTQTQWTRIPSLNFVIGCPMLVQCETRRLRAIGGPFPFMQQSSAECNIT